MKPATGRQAFSRRPLARIAGAVYLINVVLGAVAIGYVQDLEGRGLA